MGSNHNIAIMKQEKAILSPVDGVVKRVLKTANYQETKKMVPVGNGELLVELSSTSDTCVDCKTSFDGEHQEFCPVCGYKIGACIDKDPHA